MFSPRPRRSDAVTFHPRRHDALRRPSVLGMVRPASRTDALVAVAVAVVAVHVLDALARKPADRGVAAELALAAGSLATALAAVALHRRSGVAGRGLVALAVGVGAAIEGAGVTAAEVFRHGAGAGDATGIASFLAGLLLMVVGAGYLVAATPGWWRVLAFPAGFAVLLYVCVPLTMAVIATHPAAKAVGTRTPADAGLAYRDVTVQTSDGVQLSGWYMPSSNRAAVVSVPGAWSTRSDVLDQAVVLARHGYGVLDLDPRGHGLSTGSAMDLGWFGDLDLAAAVSFLAAQPDVDPQCIGILGLSMGGEEAIGAAAADARIRAVVAEGASNRTVDDLAPIAGDEWLMMPAYWVMTAASDALSPAARPTSLAGSMTRIAPRPVLLISASEDPERTLVRHLQSMAPATTTLWEPEATAHTQAMSTHPAEWEQRVVGFLDAALGGG